MYVDDRKQNVPVHNSGRMAYISCIISVLPNKEQRMSACTGTVDNSDRVRLSFGVRPPKGARPPFPDRRVPYKSSIMHVVWISVSTYVVWSDYK